ncbi:hypothetical protein BGX30_003081 [Mortierella sp. GBA39]|nr:hypothetical protein BGX30_003081 [Mortierella sp. GBA39]
MEINPAVTFKHDRSIMYAKRPKVLIVGAGLGGLTLGMLLHKADIPFDIYDKVPEIKPLGAAMYFNCTTVNLFKQCGIYEEFAALGKCVSAIKMCNEQRELEFSIEFEGHEQEFGAKGYMITRPALYGLLMRQIPIERIHLGKKVLTMDQGGNGVLIRFSDRTEAEGDILVGADGAYSAVRQGLYAKLKKADESSKENDAFRNSEYGPEAVLAMCEEVKDFPVISGGDHKYTMADLFAWSNKEHITKFMLEEKVLKTWYHCRAVLIGDACHKLNPAGGVGPANAVQDAMVLANLINGLPFHPIAEEIEAAFKAYQEERMPWVKDAHKISQTHRTMVGQSFASKSTRYVSKHIPPWLFNRIQARAFSYRPQIAFLPLAVDNGRVRPAHQPSLSVKAPVEFETVTTHIV